MARVSAAGHVVLGMLSICPMSGYDIKNLMDVSTKHFWAISYGQIYPELQRLEQAGLITSERTAGGRRRTEYRLTPAGRAALVHWLGEGTEQEMQVRDEMLLRLFFANSLPASGAIEIVKAMRARHESVLAGLRATDAGSGEGMQSFQHLVLRFGIDLHQWLVDWCSRAEKEIRDNGKLMEGPGVHARDATDQ